MIVHLIGAIAAFLGVLFTGAALYASLVEHPARLGAGTEVAATQWAQMYPRATRMQATLSVLSGIGGIGTWLHGEGIVWLWAGLIILAVVPFTLIVIVPVNHRLLEPGRDRSSAETRALLERWGRLHAVRTVLGLAASLAYLIGIIHL